MKKVSELEGAELDYWVAKAEGHEFARIETEGSYWTAGCYINPPDKVLQPFMPSSRWEIGGPLIEREEIDLETWYQGDEKKVFACINYDFPSEKSYVARWGPTPLIAAMRCFVASKFGEEVDLP